jgi:putative endonuclease
MQRTYYVYILCSETRELYIGITNNLHRRLAEHRSGYNPGSYSSVHKTTKLVYYETTLDPRAAIQREKRLKRLSRRRKLELIEKQNPEWKDLAERGID